MPPKPKPAPRQKGKRKQSKSERKQLEKMLDDITGDIVKRRDGGCVTPGGCSGPLTSSHYYPRGKKKIRWSTVNVNTQCSAHNQRHNHWTMYYEDYMRKVYSPEQMAELLRDSLTGYYQWPITALRDLLDSRRAMWLEITGEEWQPHKR